MTKFYQLNFNTLQKENTYRYTKFLQNTPFGNLTLIIIVKQNLKSGSNLFFNTIKQAFFKIDGYNFNLYQRCLRQNEYSAIFAEIGNDIYKLSPIFGVLDFRKVEEENEFSIFFIDSRE